MAKDLCCMCKGSVGPHIWTLSPLTTPSTLKALQHGFTLIPSSAFTRHHQESGVMLSDLATSI